MPIPPGEWEARVSQIAAVNAEWAGWIVEALGTADQARVAASAAQREKARTSEALLESLAQRLLAASGALDTEREKLLVDSVQQVSGLTAESIARLSFSDLWELGAVILGFGNPSLTKHPVEDVLPSTYCPDSSIAAASTGSHMPHQSNSHNTPPLS